MKISGTKGFKARIFLSVIIYGPKTIRSSRPALQAQGAGANHCLSERHGGEWDESSAHAGTDSRRQRADWI